MTIGKLVLQKILSCRQTFVDDSEVASSYFIFALNLAGGYRLGLDVIQDLDAQHLGQVEICPRT